MTLKICSVCEEAKKPEVFYGRSKQCKDCRYAKSKERILAYHKEKYAKDPEGVKKSVKASYEKNVEKRKARRQLLHELDPTRRKIQRIKQKYGLAVDSFVSMLNEQGGTCAICRGDPGPKGLVVDHCHTSGNVRSLLCPKCNSGLGFFGDNRQFLAAAIIYLEKHDHQRTERKAS